jgi:hypothetical protein
MTDAPFTPSSKLPSFETPPIRPYADGPFTRGTAGDETVSIDGGGDDVRYRPNKLLMRQSAIGLSNR